MASKCDSYLPQPTPVSLPVLNQLPAESSRPLCAGEGIGSLGALVKKHGGVACILIGWESTWRPASEFPHKDGKATDFRKSLLQ
jgi:hypothetical protein